MHRLFFEGRYSMEEKNLYKARALGLAKKAAPLLLLGLAYYIFVRITGHGLPCIIQAITKAYCPGCGISRMCVALIGGDIKAAAGYNLMVLCLLPFGAIWAVIKAYQYIKTGKVAYGKFELVLWIILLIIVVAFWVMRNLPQFAFLAPAPYGV